MTENPLILFTNDDGIESPGLWAVVRAFEGLGERLIVAPKEQQSGVGRSLVNYDSTGRIHKYDTDEDCTAYAIEATPAQCIQHGVLELVDRLPSLVVSGINYGDNLGNGITISGTVGATLEAASTGIPALAMSQQTRQDQHLSYSKSVDFTPAAHFARFFGQWLLNTEDRPQDLDILKVDLPIGATTDTDWRFTRLSRQRVYWPTRPERQSLNDEGLLGYEYRGDAEKAKPNSDIYTVMVDKLISVTPMSIDMTARVDFAELNKLIRD